MNISDAVHPPAGRDDAADRRRSRWPARSRSCCCRSSPLPQVDFPTISVSARRCPARARRRWLVGRHAARAPVRPHRRRHRDDLDELARLDQHHAAVRSRPRHRRARRATCRRRSTRRAASCRPNLPSNPTYRKVNPADAPIMILALTSDTLTQGADVRRRVDDPRAEAVAGRGRRAGQRRRQLAAGGARRAQSRRR